MEKIILLFLLSCCLISCGNDNPKTHVLDFGRFTIETPKEWEKIKLEGLDSYVGGIRIDSTDSLDFDLGFYSNNLSNYIKDPADSDVVWTIYPPLSALEDFETSQAILDTIDKYLAKIVTPIKSPRGVTGLYIDSLWKRGDQKVNFQISGSNLKMENQKLALAAFKTIKFKAPSQ